MHYLLLCSKDICFKNPFQTALQQLKIGTPTQRNTINSLLDVLKQKSYEKLLVRHLIWGAKNPLIKLGRDIKPKDDPTRYPYEKFGIFVGVSQHMVHIAHC